MLEVGCSVVEIAARFDGWLAAECVPMAARDQSFDLAAALAYQLRRVHGRDDIRRADAPLLRAALDTERARIMRGQTGEVWPRWSAAIILLRLLRRFAFGAAADDLPALPVPWSVASGQGLAPRLGVDVQGRVAYADLEAASALGFDRPRDLVGANLVRDLTPWWDQAHRVETLRSAMCGRVLRDEVYVTLRSDWYSAVPTVWPREAPLIDGEGHLVGAYGLFVVAR